MIAIATIRAKPPEFADDEHLAEALRERGAEVSHVPWDDADAGWSAYDAVVIRSTWDDAFRRDEFVAWAETVGDHLHNSPAVVRWNSDKRYLAELADAGFPVVATTFVEPDEEPPLLAGEIVVKPSVSDGARETGRFSEAAHAGALELIRSIQASGKTAIVQPYVSSVDTVGETAIVCLDGEPSHVLRKRALLRPDEVAPLRDDALGAAEILYDPELVLAGDASEREIELARAIVDHVAKRFDYVPLYARVDLIAGADGAPMLIELEAIEPNLYLDQSAGAAGRVAAAIIRRAAADS